MLLGSNPSIENQDKKMIYFEDRGSMLDAPIDVVWDFILTDNEFHSKAHLASLRNMKWKDISEITGTGTCEVMRGGRWSKMKFRVTSIRPFVRISEEFEGPYAGQKMVFLYTPKGKRTGVDVFVITPKALAKETRDILAKAHEEDVPMLRAFAQRREHRFGTIEQSVVVDASPLEVYEAYVDPKKHAEFTGTWVTGAPEVGGKFTAGDGYITGKYIKLQPGKRIVHEWTTTEWPAGYPPSILELTLKPKGAGTVLKMIHSKVPAEQVEYYAKGWKDYYWAPLKKYFGDG